MSRTAFDPATIDRYVQAGWWGRRTSADVIAANAAAAPDAPAWITADRRCSWRQYEERATDLARVLVAAGLAPGDRVGVLLADGPAVHIAFLAAELAGLVAVGIGHRAGEIEISHIIGRTAARALVTDAGRPARPDVAVQIAVDGDGIVGDAPRAELDPGRRLGPDDLFLINSTSGTTGLPKCVMHTQNRWFAFHQHAEAAADLVPEDVFISGLPAPFGFALWTVHFTPTILRAPTVVMERFDAGACLDLIERERATVLSCVSTQFIMMLDAQAARPRDLSSLRVMFTGGEAVPYERAAQFEDEVGARVLQFYGSNETGALSRTTLRDTRDRRLRTAGQLIPEMDVRMFHESDVAPGPGGPRRRGIPGCRGAVSCLGYWDDDAANAELFTPDGWMLMGDIVEVDDDGYLTVVGRTSDFIIRGGKNISAFAVEEQAATHPSVALVAAVGRPDPVFGERVCAYAELREGTTLTFEELRDHLLARGVSKEWIPEHLVVLDALPRSSGGKVAKGALRDDARRRFGPADAE